MSEEGRKGISLRTKRKARPIISAPQQISGPIQSSQSSPDVPRSAGGKPPLEPPPQQRRGKVCQTSLIKYKYFCTNIFRRLLILSKDDTPRDSITSLQNSILQSRLSHQFLLSPSSLLPLMNGNGVLRLVVVKE